MPGPRKCTEGMVYVPTDFYRGTRYPALCVDKHEFTNEDLARLSAKFQRKFAKKVPALKGFDGPQQPLINVPGREIERDGGKIPGAKELCEIQGKRLPAPKEWAHIASGGKMGTGRYSTGLGKLDRGVHYNAEATRNVCEARGAYLRYEGKEICDLNGNVWEWTYDPSGGDFYINGGSWYYVNMGSLEADSFLNADPEDHGDNIGFRCVALPPDSPTKPK